MRARDRIQTNWDFADSPLKPIQSLGRNDALDLWSVGKAESEELPLLWSCHRTLGLIHLEFELLRDELRDALEARMLRRDGQYRWFLLLYNPYRNEQGQIVRWYATGTDIEDRKQAEGALRRSEAYLAEAQRLSHTGSCAWDYHKKEINHWSPETYRVFGFDPAAGPVSWEKARSRIHPDDVEGFDRNKEQVATERIELEFDFRLVHPDGVIVDC